MPSKARIVTFDLEIKKPIERCSHGWKSVDEMGISVLCAWDGVNAMRFFDDEKDSLAKSIDYLVEADILSGFNTKKFDLAVLEATALRVLGSATEFIPGKFKLLRQKPHIDVLDLIIRAKFGLPIQQAEKAFGPRVFQKEFRLDEVARATIGMWKSGSGAHAPIAWGEGKYAEVFDYCAQDVFIEHRLVEFAIKKGYVHTGSGEQVGVSGGVMEELSR